MATKFAATSGHNFSYYLNEYWDEGADPRWLDFPFIGGGPQRLFALLGAYLAFVLYLGPRFMKNREPFDLRPVIRYYNMFLVIVNTVFFVEATRQSKFSAIMWGCPNPYWPLNSLEIKLVWFTYFLRLLELLDTVFFVLRKKQNQVSFLHVSHHVLVPILGWYGLKHATSPVLAFAPYLNTGVHSVMFLYYWLSTYKSPTVQKWLWWKKHLTKLQLIQFLLFVIHGTQPFIFRDCPYPPLYKVQCFLSTFFFFLFMSFYINAYNKRKTKEAEAKTN